ncbi:MAG: glucosidase, partial [Caldilineaceae bacterium SB0675_bin_29]|nr:glucosidase [Caldilineaceae bacterium SB0675_bin_29]
LYADDTLAPRLLSSLREFKRRKDWFIENRPRLATTISRTDAPGVGERFLTSLLTRDKLESILRYLLDEEEFLSPYGIRSLSKVHEKHPYHVHIGDRTFEIQYEPAESRSGMYGGNSNWRGPVWFPINFLIVESLQRFHHYYGDSLKVECPTGSGVLMTLDEVAGELSRRLIRLFLRNESGGRPFNGDTPKFQEDPHWRDHILFHEYFNGDDGTGLGASHQTGWTGLVAKLLQQSGGM